MLTLSPSAAPAVRRITDDDRLPDSAGVRISTGTRPDGTRGVKVGVVEQPAASDLIVDGDDGNVFVDAQLSADLDDKVLDGEIDADGISFRLRPVANLGP